MICALAPLCAAAALLAAVPASAQVVPQPDLGNPRLQTANWVDGQDIVLTALPMTALTVMLEPGEQVQRVVFEGSRVFDVRVSTEGDALVVTPQVEGAEGALRVATDRRDYGFELHTGTGLMAAYLVRMEYGSPAELPVVGTPAVAPPSTGEIWDYRLAGDRSVRPDSVTDDGARTRIEFAPGRALPAVFALGPTGDEEAVNGYMRDGIYVIDRVLDELVFRIDKDKATARRDRKREGDRG